MQIPLPKLPQSGPEQVTQICPEGHPALLKQCVVSGC